MNLFLSSLSKKLGSLLILILTLVYTTNAQSTTSAKNVSSGKISGKIVDSQTQQALDFVTISLAKPNETAASKGTYTNESGEFLFQKIPFGTYKLTISYVGYAPLTLNEVTINEGKPNVDVGDLKLKQTSNKLNEVTVTAQRSPFQVGAEGVTYNVEESLQNSGATAVEALQRIPSVQVDGDGKITVRGSSDIKVLVDGEPTELSKVLDMIPASALQKIEVLTSPSAKYSAEGSGGIINIVTKNRAGLRGSSAVIGLNANTRNRYSARLSANYYTRKFSSFNNYNYSPFNNNTASELQRENYSLIGTTYLNQSSTGNSSAQNHNFFSNNSYRFNTANSMTFNLGLTVSNNDNFNSSLNNQLDSNRIQYGNFNRTTSSGSDNLTIKAGVGYRHVFLDKAQQKRADRMIKVADSMRIVMQKNPGMADSLRRTMQNNPQGIAAMTGGSIIAFGSGGGRGGMGGMGGGGGRGTNFSFQGFKEFKTEINYSRNNRTNNSNYDQYNYMLDYLPTNDTSLQRAYSRDYTNTVNFKADLTWPFNENKSRFEAGVSSDLSFDMNRYHIDTLGAGGFEENKLLRNDFDKNDMVSSAYAQFTQTLNKFTITAGVRLEQYHLLADLISGNDDFKKNFLTLHPSVNIMYKVDDIQSLRFGYSNRVSRPSMDQLNPYINVTDPLNIKQGNINLDPSRGNTFELGYNRFTSLGSIGTSLYYRQTDDMINSFTVVTPGNASYTTYENLGQNKAWGLDVNGSIMFFAGKLNVNAGAGINRNIFTNRLQSELDRDRYSYNGNADARLTLPQNWNLGANIRYFGPQAFIQGYTKGYVTAGADLRKSFLNRKLNFTISADDLFNTRNAAKITTAGFVQSSKNQTISRVIRFGLNYNLGGFKSAGGPPAR